MHIMFLKNFIKIFIKKFIFEICVFFEMVNAVWVIVRVRYTCGPLVHSRWDSIDASCKTAWHDSSFVRGLTIPPDLSKGLFPRWTTGGGSVNLVYIKRPCFLRKKTMINLYLFYYNHIVLFNSYMLIIFFEMQSNYDSWYENGCRCRNLIILFIAFFNNAK